MSNPVRRRSLRLIRLAPRAARGLGSLTVRGLAGACRWLSTARPHRHPASRLGARGLGMVAVALAGVVLGVLLGGSVTSDLGPFRARLSVVPSFSGGTDVAIPPLGSLYLQSHAGPAQLQIRIDALDEARARALVANPSLLEQAGNTAVEDLDRGVRTLGMHVAGSGLLGALLLSALVYRSMRRVALSGGIALAVLAASGGIAAATFRPTAIQEPRYTGLLTNAPAVIGDARRIATRYEEYRAQLQRLVTNVGRIYGTVSTLPVYQADDQTARILHISDMHLNPAAWSVVQTVVQQFNINAVVDTGDITDWGSEPEDSYVNEIANLKVPYLYIRGNHDSVNTAAAVARQPNATVLSNSIVTVDGLTFAGIGDPRFTPDKRTDATDVVDHKLVVQSGAHLASTILASNRKVDVAMVHDPAAAGPLAFSVPLVLAGHIHRREVRRVDGPPGSLPQERTLLMVEGSTGGAGLRGLERADPLPLALSVLYFDSSHRLQAYDDIRVGGTGLSQVALERHLITPDAKASPSPSGSGSASGSPSPGSPNVPSPPTPAPPPTPAAAGRP